MPGAQRNAITSLASRSGPVPIISRAITKSYSPSTGNHNSNHNSSSSHNSNAHSSSSSSPSQSQSQPQYPPDDSTLQQTTTTTPNGGTVTLVNTQPGNGSDILISASESANIISIHLINGKTLRIVWENAGPALNSSTA